MTAILTPTPKAQFLANDGTPLAGGKLYTYAAGTTTPLATYVSSAGTTANTNPIILDSRGEADVWLGSAAYKFALYTADNTLIWTVDNISSGAGVSGPISGTTGTFSGALSAASGTFSGSVSGTTGTFSSSVSGTTGTFSSGVSGTTGTFTGNVTGANGTFSSGVSGTTGTFSGNVQMASANGAALAGMRNRIINASMVIDQRNFGALFTGGSTGALLPTLDRWGLYQSQLGKFTVQQNSGAVTPPAGFLAYLGVLSSSAYSVLSTDVFSIQQRIEGFNVSDFAWGTANAKAVMLSFWVRSSLTGSFGGAVSSGVGTYSYPFSYTISTANTWTQITVAIPGATAGTWGTGNTNSVQVIFSLGAGATNSGTAGAWAASNFSSVTGAVSVVGTSGATWYLTGVQLELGSVATPVEQRSYAEELMLCQRYFQYVGGVNNAPWASGQISGLTGSAAYVVHPITFRASPTLTVVNAGFNAQDNSAGPATATISLGTSSPTGSYLTYTHSALTQNAVRSLTFANAISYLQFSAEL